MILIIMLSQIDGNKKVSEKTALENLNSSFIDEKLLASDVYEVVNEIIHKINEEKYYWQANNIIYALRGKEFKILNVNISEVFYTFKKLFKWVRNLLFLLPEKCIAL